MTAISDHFMNWLLHCYRTSSRNSHSNIVSFFNLDPVQNEFVGGKIAQKYPTPT